MASVSPGERLPAEFFNAPLAFGTHLNTSSVSSPEPFLPQFLGSENIVFDFSFMDQLIAHEAILFPSDGRAPSMVQLMSSPMSVAVEHAAYAAPIISRSRVPHPEVFMDYIAEGLGRRSWQYELVEALDGMNRKFANPYIIFYPTVSRDGMPFPVNKCIREIQGRSYDEENAWRGNIVVAKYRDDPFVSLMDASMADFPIMKNYFMTHGCKTTQAGVQS